MTERIKKVDAIDAIRTIKRYCEEREHGCEECDLYIGGDCITSFSTPNDWEIGEVVWTKNETEMAKMLMKYDVDTVYYEVGKILICKKTSKNTYENFHAIPGIFFPDIFRPGYYSLNKIAKGEEVDNNA